MAGGTEGILFACALLVVLLAGYLIDRWLTRKPRRPESANPALNAVPEEHMDVVMQELEVFFAKNHAPPTPQEPPAPIKTELPSATLSAPVVPYTPSPVSSEQPLSDVPVQNSRVQNSRPPSLLPAPDDLEEVAQEVDEEVEKDEVLVKKAAMFQSKKKTSAKKRKKR